MIVFALVLGAAWRRWFGSERPDWASPGYRFMQIAGGFAALTLMQLDGPLWRAAFDSAVAIGFMTLPISISRAPFLWVMNKINPPKMWGTMLNGPEPWAEVLQGAALFGIAVLF